MLFWSRSLGPLLVVLVVLGTAAALLAGPLAPPSGPTAGTDGVLNPFLAGQPAKAAEVNHNFKVLAEAVIALQSENAALKQRLDTIEGGVKVVNGNVGIGVQEPADRLVVQGGLTNTLPVLGLLQGTDFIRRYLALHQGGTPTIVSATGIPEGKPWRVIFCGTWLDDYNGMGTRQIAPYLEVTSEAPTVGIGGITLTISRNAQGFLEGSIFHPMGGRNVSFNGTISVVPFIAVAGTTSIDVKGDIVTPGRINGLGVVPIGTVVAWHKSMPNNSTPALPDGWVECNGQTLNDTASPYHNQVIPDLNGGDGRFLKGATVNGTSGVLGGEKEHVLTVEELPGHSHLSGLQTNGALSDPPGPVATRANASYAAPIGTSTTGSSRPHNNEPQYMTVVWIMRVK